MSTILNENTTRASGVFPKYLSILIKTIKAADLIPYI